MWRLIFLLFPTLVFGQGSFNVEMLSHWHEDTLVSNSTNVRYNDCWGYTQLGNEYALAGSTEGIHAFIIQQDGSLELIDFVEGKYNNAMVIHRDIKVFQHYAYAVCDEGESSLQIIELAYLPDSIHVVAENDSTFTRVHNMFIDEENALMYACSVRPTSGGQLQPLISMQVYSLSDPLNPTLVYEGPQDIPEVHDCYVRNNIAYLNCGNDGLRVYDFSNPATPVFLQNMSFYQDQGYNHQGWVSPDGTKYVFSDETSGKELKNCTIDANHDVSIKNRFGTNSENGSVAHNIVISNELAYVAYYNEGLRIYDLREPVPKEIGYYDTYPIEEPLFKMQGAWGMYADFPSGRLLVSDRHTGLYLFDFDEEVFLSPTIDELSVYPNPLYSLDPITIKLNIDGIESMNIEVFDYLGNNVDEHFVSNASYATFNINERSGFYYLKVHYTNYLGEPMSITKKVMVL